ncbi:DUF928 domain-containing protein [Floridanema evergladense]|uniref:DUF928 domain-containing protein n=1 Tax=Floridaenema evergladense BLCC-F167 TaxID=3153639 RepID=A0ABV4WIX7_9CYAN
MYSKLKQAFLISCVLISTAISLPPSLAQIEQVSKNNADQIKIRFILANPDPPNRGTPRTNQGTGSRGNCLYKKESPPLTALVGANNLELTTKERPTFWVYVPYTSEEAPSGEFSLQDGDEDVYRTRFNLTATPGIVSVTLPPTVKVLEVGKTYRWYFEINCPNSQRTARIAPASVTGVVRRVSPSSNLENALNSAKNSLEKTAAYAQNSIWYDALTELAQLRLDNSQNAEIQQIWIELLSDRNVGLQSLAKEPIAGNVTTNFRQE